MLPDFRFVLGAVLAMTVLGVTSFGLVAAARLTHQGKVAPLEPAPSTAFNDRPNWNQFNDAESARRCDDLARKADAALTAAERAAARPASATQPIAPDDTAEERAGDQPPLDLTPPPVVVAPEPPADKPAA